MYRIVNLRFEKGQPIPVKAYPPSPEHCLAFYPYDTETVEYLSSGKEVKHVPIVLYGQFTEVTNRIIGNNFLVFQVIFYPGALYRLTGVPATEITNQYMDATTVFNVPLQEVNEQLFYAVDYPAMLKVCLLYTSDAADERSSVDLGGRRIIKTKKKNKQNCP